MPNACVLVVDDEKNILSTLSRALRIEDFDVDVAGNATIAIEKVATKAYDVLLVDVNMPGMDGIAMLDKLRADGNNVPVIVMSGHGSIDTAVAATRAGAHDYLEKPISTDRLLLSLSRCLDYQRLATENKALLAKVDAGAGLLGDSPAMHALRERIALAASANAPVLVTGERGTGKELVARAIHLGSKRASLPLEKLNCAAVPKELIESELFGHEAGSFTGATKQRRGKFERAHRGTLFLDEVGDMPEAMQAKLLRVLQEGELERVGGSELLKIDVRVVAATNKTLSAEIEEGRFRADLFDRLNVVPLRVPPLRERVRTSPRWSRTSCTRARWPTTARASPSRRARSPCSSSTTTPATCASFATWWSAWSSSRPATTSASPTRARSCPSPRAAAWPAATSAPTPRCAT
jgi:two-component system nitrogen regulation response regulator NtrX